MKLRNKLILSCAALAAVATTGFSTTFAWYTSNKTVTAGGISAKSEDAGAKLLLIADGLQSNGTEKALANLSWETSIADVVEYQPTNGMKPLAYNETKKTLAGLDTSTKKTAVSDEDVAGYLHFVLYLRNASTTEGGATVSFTLTQMDNVTSAGAAATFDNLPSKGVVKGAAYTNALSASSNANYKVDARRVLALDLETSVVDGSTTTTETTYKLSAGSSYLTGTNDASQITGGSAIDYYNDVMGTALNASETGSPDHSATITVNSAVANFVTVPSDTAGDASKYVKLDFKVYLDGWDVNCYDACQGQFFKFALSFTTA